jgi:hypothetical protein
VDAGETPPVAIREPHFFSAAATAGAAFSTERPIT